MLEYVRTAANEDEDWITQKQELLGLQAEGKELPKNWEIINELLCYKKRLYIPDNEEVRTMIAEGCHDSRVAGHFG